jgi:beta-lactamase regulating signal transducer with metallopeptidase domain
MPNVPVAIFNMSICGSAVIILAIIIRFLLRAASKKYTYFLWGIVGFRLLCPFGLNFQGMVNLLQGKEAGNIISRTEYIPQRIGAVILNSENSPQGAITLILICMMIVWLAGFIGMSLYEITSYILARKRLMTAVKRRDGVYETDRISTPFIFGLIGPKIYIPSGISESELKYVLCHEYIHIKRKDYLIKFFASFVLALHWFNPFVWLAFGLMSVDMEMSCDEKVVASLGEAVRKEYAQVIFNLSQTKMKATRSMLTFGASATRIRVRNVLNKKKFTKTGIAVTAVVCAFLVVGVISNSAVGSVFNIARNGVYSAEIRRLASTDLSGIALDGIKIGTDISHIDLSNYPADRPNTLGDYDYFFNAIRIGIDDENKVRSITASGEAMVLSVNGNTEIAKIEDISLILGNNFLDKSEDREQQLRKYIYYDAETGIAAEFIYANHTRDFAWVVLKK